MVSPPTGFELKVKSKHISVMIRGKNPNLDLLDDGSSSIKVTGDSEVYLDDEKQELVDGKVDTKPLFFEQTN